MSVYIGPERRKDQRREDERGHLPNRRVAPERRQMALEGVVVGLNAEQMMLLAELWKVHERAEERRKK